jgi:mono/diheme cytochrome c family protein
VTEIPEHLLKRSRERRQAIGGAPAEGEAATPAPSAPSPATPPARTPAATPAVPSTPTPTPPPPPEAPYVSFEKRRPKIPFWALPVLALLPLWLFFYAQAMQEPEVELVGPLAAGEELYGSCASCHGTNGEGGVGYQLSQGEVLKTFPTLEAQVTYIYTGNAPYIGQPYGDPNREGGQRVGGQLGAAGAMPAWGPTAGGSFSDVELVEVVCHERFTLAGGDQTGEEFLQWCTPEGEKFLQVEEGGLAAAGVPTGPSAG